MGVGPFPCKPGSDVLVFGRVTPESKERWRRSRGRRRDGFVGLADMDSAAQVFHLYPYFRTDPQPRRSAPESARHEWERTKDMCEPTLGRELVPIAEVLEAYGGPSQVLLVERLESLVSGDVAHRAACLRAAVPESNTIGWIIRGNDNGGQGYEICFGSGQWVRRREERARVDAEAASDPEAQPTLVPSGRSLPRRWASWVLFVLSRDLGIQGHGAAGVEPFPRSLKFFVP